MGLGSDGELNENLISDDDGIDNDAYEQGNKSISLESILFRYKNI